MKAVTKAAIQQEVDELDGKPVPMHLFGKDHWSTLGYLECHAIDNKGVIDHNHMRGMYGNDVGYPTRLASGVTLPNHSDFDCMEDLESAGLLQNKGSGINPLIKMTAKGSLVCAAIRAHKADGGSFGNFTFKV